MSSIMECLCGLTRGTLRHTTHVTYKDDDLGCGSRLAALVNVGEHWHPEALAHLLQDL